VGVYHYRAGGKPGDYGAVWVVEGPGVWLPFVTEFHAKRVADALNMAYERANK
jgi:hypothetical protein